MEKRVFASTNCHTVNVYVEYLENIKLINLIVALSSDRLIK